ncbi:PQQ-binding-like beta-propeller repeat protein [Streptomyces purpureus]|uniref:outer membrane protein assembly factor BamB family protein n=1 Tax=Streptomyces purpureus TaxID=1951 RepID=UPI00035DCEEF|nr:PQQ-binding-like beta-propeller repeat protein [Streptomyces purpureus]
MSNAEAAAQGWRRLLAILVGVAVVLGLVVGIPFVFLVNSGYLPGFSMTTAWEPPNEGESAGQGDRVWLADDTVVRSRFDSVAGFDVRSGAKRWEYVVPRRAEICAVSDGSGDPVALIAYGEAGRETGTGAGTDEGRSGKGCATVVAIDLTKGRELWRTVRTPATGKAGPGAGIVVAGGGLGVLHDGGRVRAFDLKTGAPRWTAALPKGCVPGHVAVSRKQVVAVLGCGTEAKLAAFDPAGGKARWTVPVDARRGVAADANVHVMSADPAVVSVADQDGGMRATLAFGSDGRLQSRIDDVGDHGSISEAVVEGGRLFTIASYEGGQGGSWERVVAFDLASGRELWREDVGNGTSGVDVLNVTDGRVTTVRTDWKYGDTLYVFDAATGDEDDDRAFRDHVVGYAGKLGDVLTHQDLVVAVRGGEGGGRPFSVYERW